MASLKDRLKTIGKNAGMQWDKMVGAGKKAVEGLDDMVVPGEGKASDIGKDAGKIVDEVRGKKGARNGRSKNY